jgi:RNA polymerase sigma-70 factor (ECF subfamily)
VDDLVQEVMVVLVRELPYFERRRAGSFRRWLREIVARRIQVFWRARKNRPLQAADSVLLALADPHSELSRQWDEEHNRHVLQRLLELIAQDFAPTTWQAFHRLVLDRAPIAQVAAELGLSVNAVLLTKSHVLKRLRAEGRDFLD